MKKKCKYQKFVGQPVTGTTDFHVLHPKENYIQMFQSQFAKTSHYCKTIRHTTCIWQ